MNSKQRVQLALDGKRTDRALFCPAIYEHKARLLGKAVSEVAQSAELIARAVLAEYETYQPDMLTVGIDIYNVEAEALGSKVFWPDAVAAVPAVNKKALESITDTDKLNKPNPETTGRMPLMLEAAAKVDKQIGSEVYVRGAVSGPYSMAAELLGIEPLAMAMLTQPEDFKKLMEFCSNVAITYGQAFIKRGLPICLFDSYAAPPLVSPKLYRDRILPYVKKTIQRFKKSGCEFVEYVVGGQTDAISEYIIGTGADIVLSDFDSDINAFIPHVQNKNTLVRRNLSPILIEAGLDERLRTQIAQLKKMCLENSDIFVGTGVISYNTNPDNLLAVRKAILE